MELVIIVLFTLYVVFVILLISGWQKSIWKNAIVKKTDHFISVVIAARNEEDHIGYILDDLKNQNFSSFEVLVVDDHSEDRTREFIIREIASDKRFSIFRTKKTGKKEALTTGINAAKGTVVITTDADCRVHPEWLSHINSYFQQSTTKLAFGGVRIFEDGTFFSSLQSMEFSSLIGSGAALLSFNVPSMCNGANLAFRKEIFEEVHGYEGNLEIPSGDDEFLLRKVFKQYPKGVVFMNQSETVVSTAPQLTVKRFIHQRIRWAGKWRHNQVFLSKVLALFVFSFQLCAGILMLLGIAGTMDRKLVAVLLSIKIIVEFIFLKKVSHFLRIPWRWSVFLVLQVFYPFYVVFIGLISNFQSFEWKGRTLKSIEKTQ
jgi:cellulose synthase/poly-beta-1,6-N-acetylglucosamine synthase-like glycosyltransferase